MFKSDAPFDQRKLKRLSIIHLAKLDSIVSMFYLATWQQLTLEKWGSVALVMWVISWWKYLKTLRQEDVTKQLKDRIEKIIVD